MKHLFTLFLCLVSVNTMNAQSVSLFNVDASNFPTVKAKFFAVDAANKQQRPSKSELTITENGQARTITSVTCPPPAPFETVSVAMSIDVSSSMGGSDFGDIPVELGKLTASTLCNQIPMPPSEFALQTCDARAYILQDFTTDKNKILKALTPVTDFGGNDFVEHLLNKMTGLLNVAKYGKFKKVAVLYTDAWWYALQPSELQACLDTCKKYNIEFYAVIYSRKEAESNGIKASLQQLANQTGGYLYDGITSKTASEDIVGRIQQVAQGGEPCEITWESVVACNARNINVVELTLQTQKAQASYPPQASAIASLEVTPTIIAFGKRLPSTQPDTTLTLTAINADFIVTGINRKFGSADFMVVNTTFPLSIPKNMSKTITLRFAPSDSGIKYASFEILTDLCPASFSASGGFAGKNMAMPTLKLTKPNGGEEFVVGSDTLITWEGVAKSDTVTLEYSTDDGNTWKALTTTASTLQYVWKNIPKPPSNRCKMRVKQSTSPSGTSGTLQSTIGGLGFVSSVSWSPDGTKLATGSDDRTAKIWDVASGARLMTLTGHTNWVQSVSWSPDGTRVATGSSDMSAIIWDAGSGGKLLTLTGHTWSVSSVSWSPDGSKVATGSVDNSAIIWDAGSGGKLLTLTGHTDDVQSVSWSPDGTKLATGSTDRSAIIWDAGSGGKLLTLTGHTNGVNSVSWSPDGSKVATGSVDKSAIIWDAVIGGNLLTLTGHTGFVSSFSWSPDGSKVATGSGDKTAIIWDVASGAKLLTLTGHTNYVHSVGWSPDGSKVATGSRDWTAKIWNIDAPILQEDESDAVFSIVEPQMAAVNIDLKQCLVGTKKDSLVAGFVSNSGSYKCRIDSIFIIGLDAASFSLVSGVPVYEIVAGGSKQAEFQFAPTRVGIHTAIIHIITQSETLTQTIVGEGIAPALTVVADIIDFGQVPVNSTKDTLQAITIKNTGTAPLTITAVRHAGPNDVEFTTLSGGGSFTLAQGITAKLDLQFYPKSAGRTSGRLLFDYNGVGSPATVQLFGEGVIKGVNPSINSTSGITFDSVCIGQNKILQAVIRNNGTEPLQLLRAEWITNTGNVFTAMLLPQPLAVDSSILLDIDFAPSLAGMTSAQVRWIADKDTAFSTVSGIGKICQGINPSILATSNIPFDSVCVGHPESRIATIKNNGSVPLQLIRAEWISNTGNVFSTPLIPQPLAVDSSITVPIDFLPIATGMTSAQVRWIADKDTAVSSLSGIGKVCTNIPDTARTTIKSQDITAQAGEKVNLSLKLLKSSGMRAIGAPTNWYARIHYNKSILFNEQSNNVCPGTTDSCVLELTGVYNPKSDELISIPCITTLGNTDHSSIVIDEFKWTNSAIATDVATQNGTIKITGTCEDGGVRLFIPAKNSTSLATRPNPAQDKLQIQYGLREPLTVTLELLTMTGQVVETIVNNQTQDMGQYTLTSDLSLLGNGVYLLRLKTNKEMLTTRVDVVK